MFRATDREHMIARLDLWAYDVVVEKSEDILARLKADMPPAATGGLWPQEWIDLFERWTTSGHKRLELGTAQCALTANPNVVTLTASGTFPAAGYRGWLQLESETDTAKTYVVYLEPPDQPATGTPGTFTLRERYRPDNKSVSVRDSTGVKPVP